MAEKTGNHRDYIRDPFGIFAAGAERKPLFENSIQRATPEEVARFERMAEKIPAEIPINDLSRDERLRSTALGLAIQAAPLVRSQGRFPDPITDKALLADAEIILEWLKTGKIGAANSTAAAS